MISEDITGDDKTLGTVIMWLYVLEVGDGRLQQWNSMGMSQFRNCPTGKEKAKV
jgi:hypothetical protein